MTHVQTGTVVKASSSIGRAPVSKTGGWGFDSLLACQNLRVESELASQSSGSRRKI